MTKVIKDGENSQISWFVAQCCNRWVHLVRNTAIKILVLFVRFTVECLMLAIPAQQIHLLWTMIDDDNNNDYDDDIHCRNTTKV
jgi:hypothetical protein